MQCACNNIKVISLFYFCNNFTVTRKKLLLEKHFQVIVCIPLYLFPFLRALIIGQHDLDNNLCG